MAIEIKMPALSPTMEEGTLAKWLVKVGDTVKSGDLIAEIETDKATMEFEAVDEGTIASIVVEEGTDSVKVGTVLAVLAEAGEAVDVPAAKPAEPAPVPVHEPEVTSSQQVVTADIPAVRDSIPVDAPAVALAADVSVKASPLARRIAAARQIDLGNIKGSGQGGRIMKADLVPSAPPRVEAAPVAAIPQVIVHAPPADVPFEAVKLSNMRKTIARRLTESKQTVPHFYLSDDIRLDALLKLRAELNAGLESAGIKLSVNDLLIKALAIALTDQPAANVQFAGDELYQFKRVDVSVAVAIDGGLITPVVRDAGSKRLSAIATEVQSLAARAREGRLQPQEYQGGTVSLSNLGMYGIKEMVPVINPPQALILGIGAGTKRPFVVNDDLTVATVMTATGSFDHRAIDGAIAAQFMATFKTLVEQPMLILS